MMSLAVERFEIELEHDIDEEYQYQPGQLLRGDVVLRLLTPIDLHSVRVRVRGQSTVSWEDSGSLMRDGHDPNGIAEPIKRRHQSSETYIDAEKDVLRLSDAASVVSHGTSRTFGPGEHRFHLEFILPSTLPSSFIGKFGCVTYVVMATLRRSKNMTATHLITSEPFLVLRQTRLVDHPELLIPVETVLERRGLGFSGGAGRTWCCCCLPCGGEIRVRFLLQKTGFLPDEDVVIDAEVANRTSLTVDAFEAVLVLRSRFRAMNSVREHVQIVARENHACLVGVESQFSVQAAVRLTIPPYVPESHLEGCDIIDIDYQVHLLVILSDDRRLETSLPITMVTADDQRPPANVRSADDEYRSSPVQVHIPASTTTKVTADNGIWNNGYLDESDGVHCSVSSSVGVGVACDADDNDLERFRHPMEPGGTRRNIIFDDEEDEEELCSSAL